MKITIISSSHQLPSQSLKVSNYFAQTINNLKKHMASVVDLAGINLPFFNFVNLSNQDTKATWENISSELATSDGYVIVSPEYGGMATPILKNFFLYASGKKEMAFKPTIIVGVSSGRGGAYVVSDLRSNSYKNCMINYLPEHIIVRECNTVLNDDLLNPENKGDYYLKQRINYAINLLLKHAEANQLVINSNAIDTTTYPNGM